MMGYNYGFGGYLGMFIYMLIPLVLIGLIFYLFFSRTTNKDEKFFHRESPLDVLKKRYVNGELSKEEYLEIKKDITD